MEISSQVEAAVVLDAAGEVLGSTSRDEARSAQLARAVRELLAAAERVRSEAAAPLTQLDVATGAGSVFVVREGERLIAATTAPSPTIGLVFYDLKTCLRALDTDEAVATPVEPAAPAAPPAPAVAVGQEPESGASTADVPAEVVEPAAQLETQRADPEADELGRAAAELRVHAEPAKGGEPRRKRKPKPEPGGGDGGDDAAA